MGTNGDEATLSTVGKRLNWDFELLRYKFLKNKLPEEALNRNSSSQG